MSTTFRKHYRSPYNDVCYDFNAFLIYLDTIGGACMSPREQDGVVDRHLKVYGLKNVRVADLSVVPLHFGAHSQGDSLILLYI